MNTNWFIIKRKRDKNSRNLFSIQFSNRKQTNVIVLSILFTNILMFEPLRLLVGHPRHSTELRIDPDPLRHFLSGFVHSFTFNMFKLANMA